MEEVEEEGEGTPGEEKEVERIFLKVFFGGEERSMTSMSF